MPILFVHGVNVRDRSLFEQIEPLLRQWVAPAISKHPDQVVIGDAYWGDLATSFAWGGASRPRSRILGMGAATPAAVPLGARLESALLLGGEVPAAPAMAPVAGGGLASGFGRAAPGATTAHRIRDLSPDDLADLLCNVLLAGTPAGGSSGGPVDGRARAALLADRVAQDTGLRAALSAAADLPAELALIERALEAHAAAGAALAGMGFKDRWRDATEHLREVFQRADDLPLYAASIGLLEARKWAHEAISLFAGDVVTYIGSRTPAAPGPIVQRVLDKLVVLDQHRQGSDEPLVVLTHSMGGQIVYDLVTWFLPRLAVARPVRIDFWCATASQVGFFEEAKLFLASDRAVRAPATVPFPAQSLGVWWNVWDPNDVLSFTVRDIVAQVDDAAYDSGMPLTRAHGGYLQRRSFYRALSDKLQAAAAAGWKSP